ncbi:hypothetical protein ACOMHN_040353 [Nucella lapillus]
MSSSALLRIACSQLGRLSRRIIAPGLTSLTEQSQRFCHDDSNQRKQKNKIQAKPKKSTERTFSKAVGPAVNLLEKDLQNILREHEQQEKLQARSSLQRRMDLLLSLGCTMDQIQNKVKVLDLSEQVILERANMLKDIGRSPVTVNLLLSSSYSNLDLLRQHMQHIEELDTAKCSVLECSLKELDCLKAQHPSLNRFLCLTAENILQKSQLLQSYGLTSKEIKAFPSILNIKVENIRHRMETLKTLREEGKVSFDRYPLNIISQRTRAFDKSIENAVLGRAEVDGSRITFVTIARRLGVKAKDIEDASINFYKLGPSSILKKIDYLLGEGIPNVEIVSHIYIMKYRLEILQQAVEKSKEVVVSHPPPIYIILSFLRSGHLPKRSFVWSRQRRFVASLLGIHVKELLNSSFLRPLWSMDRICIKRNFDFLVSEGFSADDILSCVVLLAHDPDHLQAHYHSLWERPEVAGHGDGDTWSDRKQVLSLLQYVIEREMNFTSSVFNAEVEFDPGILEKGAEK